MLCKFEGPMLKNKNFKILTVLAQFWGWGLKWKHKTKIFQEIWCQGPKINLLCKFEGPTLKNKNLKILTICVGPADPKQNP